MKSTICIIVRIIVASNLLIFVSLTPLTAASPTRQPTPLRNLSLMIETSGGGLRQTTLRLNSKTTSSEKQSDTLTAFRKKIWQVDGINYDIPIEKNFKVQSIIRRLTSKKRKQLIQGIRRSGRYKAMIVEMLRKEGMPLDLIYMVPAESNFNVRSHSHKSAVGMWQFIASTGRLYGLKINRWIDERRDPILATQAAIRYLKHLYGLFGDWEIVMAAYNTGEGRVKRAIKRAKLKGKPADFWSLRLPRETRGYVPTIMAMAIIYKSPEHYGLGHIRPVAPLDETRVSLPVAFSMEEVARRAKMSFRILRKQNPALFLGVPPMTQERYTLYVPRQHQTTLRASLKQNTKPSKQWSRSYSTLLGNSSKVTQALEKFGAPIYFRVRNGDNLWDLAKKHKTTVRRLARWNRLNSKSVLRVKQRLKIYVPTWRVFKEIAGRSSSNSNLVARRIRVSKGAALSKIARKYRTSVRKLMRWNKLSSPHAIRIGQRLVVGYRTASSSKTSKLTRVIRVPRNTTLSHLALRYKTSVKQLMRWNGLNHPKQLRTGMRLVVQASAKKQRKSQKTLAANTSSGKALRVRHRIIRVRSGDTLWEIARQYRTSVADLVALNELKSAHRLRLNQKLLVPDRS